MQIFLTTRVSKSKGYQRKRDYEPVKWTPYFDHSEDVKIGQDTFHIYTKGTEGPTLVLLHGGGYSALTWAEFTVGIKCSMQQAQNSLYTMFVLEFDYDYGSVQSYGNRSKRSWRYVCIERGRLIC